LYLGVIHPDHLLQRLTSRQWAGWLVYLSKFPLPHDRADFNAALVRGTAMACAGAKNVKPHKLIPAYGKVSRRLSKCEIQQRVKDWAGQKKANH